MISTLSVQKARWIRGISFDLLDIELDAEARRRRNQQITVLVELERIDDDPVQIGAAADELDVVDERQGRGELQVAIGGRYPLERAADAYRDLEARRTTGKLLVLP